MPSALQRLLNELGQGQVRADTYDVSEWASLPPADQQTALAALEERVATHDDVRAAITLCRVGADSAYDAIEALSERVSTSSDQSLLAGALSRLRPQELTAVAGLIISLGTAESRIGRLNAATELGNYPGTGTRAALLAALTDDDDLVRAAALKALCQHVGIDGLTHDADGRDELRSPLRVLERRLLNRLESVAAPARTHLSATLSALDNGATPASLGLVYTPGSPPIDRKAIGMAVAQRSKPLPMSDLAASSGHDRAWIDALLLGRLQAKKQDVRAPAALKALGTTGRESAMREAIRGLDDDDAFRIAVEASL